MTKTTELIRIITHSVDPSSTNPPLVIERTGVVYKKRDGREWVYHEKQYFVITRENGVAVLHRRPGTSAP